MSPAIRASHLGLCVTDLERSLRFWCDGLGFEPGERYDLDSALLPELHRALEVRPPVALVSQFVRREHLAIELLQYAEPRPDGVPSGSRGTVGFTHLAFHVEDLAAALDHLVAHGATVVDGTRVDVGVPVVFVQDPDGARVELMETPTRPAGGAGAP